MIGRTVSSLLTVIVSLTFVAWGRAKMEMGTL